MNFILNFICRRDEDDPADETPYKVPGVWHPYNFGSGLGRDSKRVDGGDNGRHMSYAAMHSTGGSQVILNLES